VFSATRACSERRWANVKYFRFRNQTRARPRLGKPDEELSVISSHVLVGSRARDCDTCQHHRHANTELGLSVLELVAPLGAVWGALISIDIAPCSKNCCQNVI
jgi:hypothetical protein